MKSSACCWRGQIGTAYFQGRSGTRSIRLFFMCCSNCGLPLGGEQLLWLRLFPVLVSTLCLVPVFLLCGELRIPRGARNLAVFMASVHPYAIYFAQHMRMYCLLALFGLTSIWAFERYLKDGSRRNLIILSASHLLLVYSHYYGWLIVGLEFLYLLWKKRSLVLPFMVASALVLALFCPWAWVAAQSLHAKGGLADNLGWVPRPDRGDLSWFYVELSGVGGNAALGVATDGRASGISLFRLSTPRGARLPLAGCYQSGAGAGNVRCFAVAVTVHLGQPPPDLYALAVSCWYWLMRFGDFVRRRARRL